MYVYIQVTYLHVYILPQHLCGVCIFFSESAAGRRWGGGEKLGTSVDCKENKERGKGGCGQ